ncbi:MAG: SDR family oxidoreductase [Candidatus Marinimicrobia bacterium]|jgi:nucleoside-diphosphate-sugar epimerase|nr:SDR family oxidoreductase [Candidatus Neomarinimicrobiota bacterium]MBT3633457.1 SDR family oxidoreductase [Candidatus Neomarinimicrobiota bacterium]MBT3681600.1 SDR family oxidoreductase [Candidatus Neomarinimicrobiota bacterium]MBT3758433.1 SDR family oxidoreductase [Candidatus Neomarinimicrobiota bacterium]MBT3894913.1 SDR family oxidoreductase [Candidatus Neomarinimicrobiota bacterium]
MNIMVTGGCGYVGTILVNKILTRKYNVTVVDTMWFGNYLENHPNLLIIKEDIRNIDNIPMEGIDCIIHLANIANDPSGDLDSKLTWEVNVLASKLLVEKAIDSGVKQFIYASSGSVYGVKDEDQVTEELSLIPISDYNKTKMISERVFLSYSDKINLQCIRPATVCGYSPRMRLDLSVNMLTMQALRNKRITVFGGNQTRPNIHIADLVNIYLHFIDHGKDNPGIFNAGFENLSILEIANIISNKIPSEIIVTESNDPRSYRLNSDRLLNTGFQPQFGVSIAIEEIIEVFESGLLKDEDKYYNIKTMNNLINP